MVDPHYIFNLQSWVFLSSLSSFIFIGTKKLFRKKEIIPAQWLRRGLAASPREAAPPPPVEPLCLSPELQLLTFVLESQFLDKDGQISRNHLFLQLNKS